MNRYPALVRGEDGGLDVRVFRHREDAERHSVAREVAPERYRKARWTPERVGNLIGVSGRTIARRAATAASTTAGGLACSASGTRKHPRRGGSTSPSQ